MMLLSIIIPCYNMGKYVRRCYNSLQIQLESADVEFIFVNDGSKDDTLLILQELKSKDNRIILINQNNSGVSAARNAAIKIARGKFIYLLDGDDYLTNNAIYDIKKIIREYDPDLLISAYNISKNDLEIFKALPFREGLYDKKTLFASISHFPTAPQLVYRTNIIKKENIQFDSSIKCGEVYAFTINYMKYINDIYVLNKATFNYFQRSESAIHKLNYQNDITVIKALNSIYNNGDELSDYSSFAITAFKLMYSFSYNKYLKYSTGLIGVETIEYVLSCDVVRRCIKDVLFKPHNLIRDRLMALYMYIMPKKIGFLLINSFIRKRKL